MKSFIKKHWYFIFLPAVLLTFTGCDLLFAIILAVLGGGNSNTTVIDAGKIEKVYAIAGDKEICVYWESGDLTGYTVDVTCDTTNVNKTFSNKENAYVFTGLNNGCEYTFTVSTSVNSVSARGTPFSGSVKSVSYGSGSYGSGSNACIEVDKTDKSVIKITGVSGKSVQVVNVNHGTNEIPATSLARAYVSGIENSSRTADASGKGTDIFECTDDETLSSGLGFIREFVPPTEIEIEPASSSRSLNLTEETYIKTAPKVGQCRYVYVDNDSNISKFKPKMATLRAIGYNGGNTVTSEDSSCNVDNSKIDCLVWVVNEYWDTSSAGNKVNADVCRDIAEKFSENYKFEQKIFGDISSEMYSSNSKEASLVDMSDGKSGDYVNIVLYDIGVDYNSDKPCGVVGYFYSKDYIMNPSTSYEDVKSGLLSDLSRCSNEGKFFYIDTPFANLSGVSKNGYEYNGTGNASETVISTLFHEFQHMINFAQKNLNGVQVTNTDTWYNEMLSMLSEDLMGKVLGISEEEKVDVSRLRGYNNYYFLSGLAEYRNDDYAVVSYSTAYALGAYLARNYGGAELVHEISTNRYYGAESIVNAVNEINKTNKTFDQLVDEVVKASVFRDSFASVKGLPTFNKAPAESTNISDGTKTTSLKGINLFGEDYKYQLNKDNPSLYNYGPVNFIPTSNYNIRSQGFIVYGHGTAGYDEVTVYVAPRNSGEKVMICIQDARKSTDKDTAAVKTQQ